MSKLLINDGELQFMDVTDNINAKVKYELSTLSFKNDSDGYIKLKCDELDCTKITTSTIVNENALQINNSKIILNSDASEPGLYIGSNSGPFVKYNNNNNNWMISTGIETDNIKSNTISIGGIELNGNNGNITCNEIITSSDKILKKNISYLENSLDKVLKLQGYSYNWKKDKFPEINFSNDLQIGFIAQEVKKVVPELVKTRRDGYMGIAYDKISVLLVESIKEQNEKINNIENEVGIERIQNDMLFEKFFNKIDLLEIENQRLNNEINDLYNKLNYL